MSFTKIDNDRIEQAHTVGQSAFTVYAAIARHCDEQRKAWPGIDRLGMMAGLAPRSVRYAIEHLENAGWLVVERKAGQRNTYYLHPADSRATSCQPPETSKAMDCQGVGQPVAAGEATSCQGVGQPVAAEVYPRTIPTNKTKRTKPKRGCAAEVVFPSELSSESFKEAWEAWTAHRKEKRQPLTPSTTTAQLKKLATWGEARSIAAIDRSIEAGWTGIFEAAPGRTTTNYATGPGQKYDPTAPKLPVKGSF